MVQQNPSPRTQIFYWATLGNGEQHGVATMEDQQIVFYSDDGQIERLDLPTAQILLTLHGRTDLAETQRIVDTIRGAAEKAALLAGSRLN